MIGTGLYLGLGPQGIFRKDQVLDTWAILIEKGSGLERKVSPEHEIYRRRL
jgi:hypothetical protein